MGMSKKNKRVIIICLISILSLLVVTSAFWKYVILPRNVVIDDVNRFDELKVGNKVVLGDSHCNNTWRVEKKKGTRVLLVNEKSIQETYFFEETLKYHILPPHVLDVIGETTLSGSQDLDKQNTLASTKLIYYLQILNTKYIAYLFPYSVNEERNMRDLRQLICYDSGDLVFIRVRFGIFNLDINHSNVYDYDSLLMRLPREYYPAMWIDTAVIKSNK